MKLLIIGGTGVISRSIVRQAVESGLKTTLVNRGLRAADAIPGARGIRADRGMAAAFADALRDEEPDVVIDMIAFTPDDVRQTVELFRDRARHIIVTSSVAAYARPYRSLPVREEAEQPLLDAAVGYEYGRQKALMEQYLFGEMRSDGAALTIIRPSLTFGPGARNFGTLRQNMNVVSRMRAGKPLVMVGEGVAPWNFTYVDDLARAYLLACGNEHTYNNHFHIAGEELLMWEDLYRLLGEVIGAKPILYYVPSALLRAMDPALCGHLYYEKTYPGVLSCEKFRRAVPAFRPVWRFRDALAKVLESWERDGLGVDAEKDALEDAIAARYETFRDSLVGLRKGT